MNQAQKTKLAARISTYVRAAVELSWKGSSPPDESAEIEQHAKKCLKALNDELNAAVTNDTERLNLLLDTMLAVANDMKLPPAGQLLMDAMSGHTADGTILTGDDMKGMLDVALSTIPVSTAPVKPETVQASGNNAVVDHAPAAPQGDWTPADERTRPCS